MESPDKIRNRAKEQREEAINKANRLLADAEIEAQVLESLPEHVLENTSMVTVHTAYADVMIVYKLETRKDFIKLFLKYKEAGIELLSLIRLSGNGVCFGPEERLKKEGEVVNIAPIIWIGEPLDGYPLRVNMEFWVKTSEGKVVCIRGELSRDGAYLSCDSNRVPEHRLARDYQFCKTPETALNLITKYRGGYPNYPGNMVVAFEYGSDIIHALKY